MVFDAFGLSPPPFLRFRRLGLLPSGGVFVVVVVVVVVSSRSRAPPVVVAVVSSRRIVVFFSMCFRFGMAVATAPPSTRRTIIGVNDFRNSSNSFVSLTSKTRFAEPCFDFVASSCSRASSAFRWASATFAAVAGLVSSTFRHRNAKKRICGEGEAKRETSIEESLRRRIFMSY